jgi:CRP-like cAMP-binding protein
MGASALDYPDPATKAPDTQGPSAAHAHADLRALEPGEIVYRAGDPAGALFVVVSGTIKLYQRAAKGALLLAATLGPGSLFGVDSLSAAAHGETALAEHPSMVREVPVQTLDRLVARQRGFGARVLEALVQRRTAAEKLLARAIIAGVPGRLAGSLLDAAQGDVVDGHTRQELAEAAWTTRETATRVLFHFAEDGLVRVEGRRVVLLDRTRLRRLAGGAREVKAA